MKSVFIFFLLIFTSLFCSSNKKSSDGNDKFSEIDTIIIEAMKDKAFPGAVLLVSKDGDIIYEKGFGNFTYDINSNLVSGQTIYDIASLTKVVATTTAIMICYDRNMFELDDPVSKYIPEFAQNGKGNITIKNLLLHNSGLPAWKKYYGLNLTSEDIITDIFGMKPDYTPGTKTVYSDLGFIVLGKIIEKVTNNSFDKFCSEEIFSPLGMKNTFFNPNDSLKNNIAPTELDNYWRIKQIQGEVHDEIASLLDGVAGNAGLFSNASDLSKFLQMVLNNGYFNGKQLIKKETIELFTKKQSEKSSRALGWDLKSKTGSSSGKYFSENSFGHLGFTGTSLWIDPVRNLFVVFLTNRVYPSRENKKIVEVRPKLHDTVMEIINTN